MKTQISQLINGNKEVRIDASNPKYLNAPKSSSHIGFGGSSQKERDSIAQIILSENPECLNIRSFNKEFSLSIKRSTTGKSWWYETTISEDNFMELSGTMSRPHGAQETAYFLNISMDMKVSLHTSKRRNERCTWKTGIVIDIDESFIQII